MGRPLHTARRRARVLVATRGPAGEASLSSALSSLGHDVLTADSADATLDLLRLQKLDGVLLDLDLAGGMPVPLVRRILRVDPTVVLLVVGGAREVDVAVACLRAGALDYLPLPVAPARLELAIVRVLRRRSARVQALWPEQRLRAELARVKWRLRKAQARASRPSLEALEFLVHMMELRDRHLAGHSVRVAQLAASMAAELGRTEAQVEQVRVAGRLHDVGMLCIGDGILSKTGPLTSEEVDRVKQHVVIGDDILAQLPRLEVVRGFVRSHHERWDGRGYPDGLGGQSIPWGAQLIGAAEVYDAFTTSRPYRTSVAPDEAIEQMGRLRGAVVSPEVYDVLATIVKQGRALVFVESDRESRLSALESHAALARPA